MKSILFILAILSFGIIQAQNNFQLYTPKPKPGDEITITYMPGADLEGLLKYLKHLYWNHPLMAIM